MCLGFNDKSNILIIDVVVKLVILFLKIIKIHFNIDLNTFYATIMCNLNIENSYIF